jgi:hypothetical protein
MENVLADLPLGFPEEIGTSMMEGIKRRLRALERATTNSR